MVSDTYFECSGLGLCLAHAPRHSQHPPKRSLVLRVEVELSCFSVFMERPLTVFLPYLIGQMKLGAVGVFVSTEKWPT